MITDEQISFYKKQELDNCTFCKTVLMLIIVLYHSMIMWTGRWANCVPIIESSAFKYVSIWMNSFHIYAFALISGYIYYYIRYEKSGNSNYIHFVPFVKSKAKRLLVPYVFIVLVWAVPFAYLYSGCGMGDILYKFVLGTNPDQLWFLLMLFGVFVVFCFLSDFFKKHEVIGAFVALIIYVVGCKAPIPNYFQICTVCRYVVFFLIGFKIRQHSSKIVGKITASTALLLLVADIGLFAVIKLFDHYDIGYLHLLFLAGKFALYMLGAVMAFYVLQTIARAVDWKNSRLFMLLSRHSMTVFLLHQQLIYVTLHAFNGLVSPWLNVLINFVFALGISLGLSVILHKFKVTRFLIGEKA